MCIPNLKTSSLSKHITTSSDLLWSQWSHTLIRLTENGQNSSTKQPLWKKCYVNPTPGLFLRMLHRYVSEKQKTLKRMWGGHQDKTSTNLKASQLHHSSLVHDLSSQIWTAAVRLNNQLPPYITTMEFPSFSASETSGSRDVASQIWTLCFSIQTAVHVLER